MALTKKEAHQPFAYEVEGSQIVVLFIHGFLEGPYQFQTFANYAKDLNISAYGILLPGHGGSAREFANSHRHHWLRYVRETIENLARRYAHIILVGHSMGSLLSLLNCNNYPQVKGVVALATPLHIKLSLKGFKCYSQLMFSKKKHYLNPHIRCNYRAWSVAPGTVRDYLSWLPRFKDLFYLIHLTRRSLKNVDRNLLFIHCGCDEFIRSRTRRYLKKRVKSANCKIEVCDKSYHCFYDEEEGKKIDDAFKVFLQQLKKEITP